MNQTILLKVVLFGILCAVVLCRRYSYEDEDDDDEPVPYEFGYAVQDHHSAHFRRETADADGVVKGSYGFTDENGIRREVHYVADDKGFRAQIKTNEPGTISGNPADVDFHSGSRHHEEIFHQFRRYF